MVTSNELIGKFFTLKRDPDYFGIWPVKECIITFNSCDSISLLVRAEKTYWVNVKDCIFSYTEEEVRIWADRANMENMIKKLNYQTIV